MMLDVQLLFERKRRLETLMKVDVPIFNDVARSIGSDIAERLDSVLREYGLLIEACLQEVERKNKRGSK
jgi:hypothetical protein